MCAAHPRACPHATLSPSPTTAFARHVCMYTCALHTQRGGFRGLAPAAAARNSLSLSCGATTRQCDVAPGGMRRRLAASPCCGARRRAHTCARTRADQHYGRPVVFWEPNMYMSLVALMLIKLCLSPCKFLCFCRVYMSLSLVVSVPL